MTEFYVQSNLTPREAFRMHGALPDSMIEMLIDNYEDHAAVVLPAIDDIDKILDSVWHQIQEFIIYAEENENYNDSLDMDILREIQDGLLAARTQLERIEE
jgi:hypothetical protein